MASRPRNGFVDTQHTASHSVSLHCLLACSIRSLAYAVFLRAIALSASSPSRHTRDFSEGRRVFCCSDAASHRHIVRALVLCSLLPHLYSCRSLLQLQRSQL